MRRSEVSSAVHVAMVEIASAVRQASASGKTIDVARIVARMASGKLVPKWARGYVVGYWHGQQGEAPNLDLIHREMPAAPRRRPTP